MKVAVTSRRIEVERSQALRTDLLVRINEALFDVVESEEESLREDAEAGGRLETMTRNC